MISRRRAIGCRSTRPAYDKLAAQNPAARVAPPPASLSDLPIVEVPAQPLAAQTAPAPAARPVGCIRHHHVGRRRLGGNRPRRRRGAQRQGHSRRRPGFPALLLDGADTERPRGGHRPHDSLLSGAFRQAARAAHRLLAGRRRAALRRQSAARGDPRPCRSDRRHGHVRARPVRISREQLDLGQQFGTGDPAGDQPDHRHAGAVHLRRRRERLAVSEARPERNSSS